MTSELFNFDIDLHKKGFNLIAGIDEAGRGPLCGPVVVGCCVMPLEEEKYIDGINDSKKLSEKKRELLYDKIISTALFYSVSIIDSDVIDDINILNATKKGMIECIDTLGADCDVYLIDAVKLDTDKNIVSIVKGDATSYNIAAASIIAKVTRDRLMAGYDALYPMYGFLQNKGYGTAKHIEALKKFGPTPIHRTTFIKHFIVNDESNIG